MHSHCIFSATTLLTASLASAALCSAQEPVPFPPGKATPIRFVAWQGGDVLVVVGQTHAAAWEVGTGKQRGQRRLGSAPMHEMAESPVSPDGKRLCVIDKEPKEGIGRLVPLGVGPATVLAAPGKSGPFQFLGWSADGGRLLCVDEAHVLHLWDAANGKYVGKLGGPSDDPSLRQVTFTPPGEFRKMGFSGKPLPGNKMEAAWGYSDVGTLGGGSALDGVCEAWRRPTWSPDGRYLLTMARMSRRQPLVVLWNGHTGEALASLSVPGRLYHQWAFSPDSRRLAFVSADVAKNKTSERADSPWDTLIGTDFRGPKVPQGAVALRLIDPETGATLRRLDGDFSPHRFAWSPDSRRLLVASMGMNERSPTRDLACWDATTGRRLWTQEWQPTRYSKVLGMTCSPDGKYIAVTARLTHLGKGFDQNELWLHILETEKGKQVLEKKLDRLVQRNRSPAAPTWAPESGRVRAGSVVADAKAGKVLFDLFPDRGDDFAPTFSAVWQPGGKLLAVWQGGNTPVRLISAETGKTVRQFPEAKP